ncbi:RDD family protein [Rhodococcus erythropolis]|uniref:RDD family protein n=1 Tax=Rhodococcus erythropolis TaxID=1833 RepID=UPI003013E928
MTTGGYDPNQNPEGGKQFPPQDPYGQQGTPPPGSYPPPAGPPQGGSYPPPPQGGNFPPPQGGNYPPPGGYPPPPQGGNFPPPPQFNDQGAYGGGNRLPSGAQPGDLWIRLGARIIDGIIVGIIAAILALLVSDSDSLILISGLFSGILTFAYFVAMEVTQGRTLGKMILGLSVHGPGGAPRPSVQQSAIRNAFTLLSIIPIIGGILALVAYIVIAVTINNSPTKQGKHDELAGGTQVVKG